MTLKEAEQIIAAVMGKCWHDVVWSENKSKGYGELVCVYCGETWHEKTEEYQFSVSLDGESTKEVRDWFAKEMPEWWEKYLNLVFHEWAEGLLNVFSALTNMLSIINLAQFCVDHPEMFWGECPYCDNGNFSLDSRLKINPEYVTHFDCGYCNGTGKIVISRFAEAVEAIRRYLDGK